MAQKHGVQHYTLTFSGAAQRLSDALADTTVGGPDDIPCDALTLQPDGANAAACYVGGATSTITSGAHGVALPAGSSGAPPPPWPFPIGGRAVKMSEIYIKGTVSEKIHIIATER